jgi:hypothetical protein
VTRGILETFAIMIYVNIPQNNWTKHLLAPEFLFKDTESYQNL